MDEIDTTNEFMVAGGNGSVMIMLPPVRQLSPLQAKRLAAWLAVVADGVALLDGLDEPEFVDVLQAVENT
ncbi:MAG: hypothetical protein M3O70_08730 [Actinomycetota bacterium]|nr:hypothetical protein [Actinomycetota bacterium]